jgi:hypothetical protein
MQLKWNHDVVSEDFRSHVCATAEAADPAGP